MRREIIIHKEAIRPSIEFWECTTNKKRHSTLDVKLIFGIEDGNVEIRDDLKFNVSTRNRALELREKLFGNENIVRVLCLLLFESLFFTNTGSSLAWRYLNFVVDFEILNSFDWSKYILDKLKRGLDDKDKDPLGHPTKVNECTLFLQYWFCEYCQQTCDIYEKQIKEIEIPRFMKWEASILDEAVEKSFITVVPLKFKWKKLVPSPAEMERILSLKGMREVDELTDSDALPVFDVEEHPEKKIGESRVEHLEHLEQEVRRMQLELEVEKLKRIEIQEKLDEQMAHNLLLEDEQRDPIKKQQRLEEEVARNTELRSELNALTAELQAPRGILRRPAQRRDFQ